MAKKKNPLFILDILEKLYEWRRPKVAPEYPYNRETDTVHLPPEIIAELKKLIKAGESPKALKRVADLTGASLRISKDYVDALRK